ncbi:alpha-ketoglutarate dehydrogenase component 4 [Octopus bimaculoides]|uniref:28S ribosomal protein S36, mitochondrial n=1 Tax=Octopus bimaculoides TaxID=37653 RepID=A0A0L8HKB6_OCTBM|nr:alpha-ketoglutarate dehydrogenase component 4 [Octopus bimaculoides]|eukprot:XP_014771637.1 PREDICTED: 28S ribosomal protein S36, mitochondrial-like [Octopus bimaculoides]
MAASGVRTIRAIKPHVPLIKFPDRRVKGVVKSTSSQNMTPSTSPNVSKSTNITLATCLEWEDLPAKYHRKSLTPEEMEFIERGGPA